MIIQEISKKYPKSFAKLKEWIVEGLKRQRQLWIDTLSAEQKMGMEFPEIEDVKDEEIGAMVVVYTRRLYDFFDTQELFTIVEPETSKHVRFEIRSADGLPISTKAGFSNRTSCELVMFEEAFKLLEEKL